MKAMQDMIHEAHLPMESLWISALELGTIHVFVALVLSQLTDLKTLYLDVDSLTDKKFLGLLFKHALLSNQSDTRGAHHVSAFPALNHVRFSLTHSSENQGMRGRVSIDIVSKNW